MHRKMEQIPTDVQVGLERKTENKGRESLIFPLTPSVWGAAEKSVTEDQPVQTEKWCMPGDEGRLAEQEYVLYRITRSREEPRMFIVLNQPHSTFGSRDMIIRGHLTDIKRDHEDITDAAWRVVGESSWVDIPGFSALENYDELKRLLAHYVMCLD